MTLRRALAHAVLCGLRDTLHGLANGCCYLAAALEPQPDRVELEFARLAAIAAHPASGGPWADGEAS